jgi:uncharacterized membrane protein
VRELLDWLAPPIELPGRTRAYHRLLWIFGAIPAAGWLLSMLPLVYTLLVGLVALAVLLAWILLLLLVVIRSSDRVPVAAEGDGGE